VSLIYVATKWSRRAEAKEVMRQLIAAGHVITHDWTEEEEMEGADSLARDKHFALCAEADVRGVRNADWLLLLHGPDMRGAYVELGMALASGVRVLVVDGAKPGADPALTCPIFYWLPQVRHAPTVEAALALLASGRRAA
jgi:hypothetical protein